MNNNLKQLITEISRHAGVGRMQIFSPVGRFSSLQEVNPPPAAPEEDKTKEQPPQKGGTPPPPPVPAPDSSGGAPPAPDQKPSAPPQEPAPDAEAAQRDAVETKKKAEAAKVEKAQAEQELQQSSGVKLTSKAGVSFLLGKLLDDAMKKNLVDSLAAEFVDKLKINTPEGLQAFKDSTSMFTNLKGYPRLISSIQTLISK